MFRRNDGEEGGGIRGKNESEEDTKQDRYAMGTKKTIKRRNKNNKIFNSFYIDVKEQQKRVI